MTSVACPFSIMLDQPTHTLSGSAQQNPVQHRPAQHSPVHHSRSNPQADAQSERVALDRSEDTDLLALIAHGSRDRERAEGAFEVLYQRHSRNVFSLARRILRDQAASEEIVQDVFMKLWLHAGKFDAQRGSVGTWLMTIAHHSSIDHLRRVTSKPLMYPEDTVLEAMADPVQPKHQLDGLLIEEAMRALTNDERELIELAYFQGLSHSQIATRTNVPLGTIKTRIRSALMRLRERLTPN